MAKVRPTRFYSNRQEERVAKSLGGRKVSNSGATDFHKGDVTLKDWLIECKTVTKRQKQFTIHKNWLEKNAQEAFEMDKQHNALTFDFGDGEQFYIIDERTFKKLLELLEVENEM